MQRRVDRMAPRRFGRRRLRALHLAQHRGLMNAIDAVMVGASWQR